MDYLFHKAINSKDSKIILVICISAFFISRNNYVLFHTFIEIVTIIISFSLMIIALGTTKICDNSYFSYLGICYGFIGFIDLFHTFSYKGIEIFSNTSNIPTQFWVAGRYYESAVLICSLLYFTQKVNVKRLLFINFIIISAILVSILAIKIFPSCYVEGYGLTKFKKYSEYIISLLFLGFIIFSNTHTEFKNQKEYKFFSLAIFFKIISEICFTSYFGVYDFTNFIGHIMKGISFYFLYKALFKSVIINPYSTLFRNLNIKALELESKNRELSLAKDKIEEDYLTYRKFIEFFPEGILLADGDKIVYKNNKFCSMFDLDHKESIINSNIYEIIGSSYHKRSGDSFSSENKENSFNATEYELCINT